MEQSNIFGSGTGKTIGSDVEGVQSGRIKGEGTRHAEKHKASRSGDETGDI